MRTEPLFPRQASGSGRTALPSRLDGSGEPSYGSNFPTERLFHISLYLTLALATACLGFAELTFLPEIGWFLIPIGLLLLFAFALEGRWTLSLRAANVLGLLIAVGSIAWLIYFFTGPLERFHYLNGSLAALTLPQIGPV